MLGNLTSLVVGSFIALGAVFTPPQIVSPLPKKPNTTNTSTRTQPKPTLTPKITSRPTLTPPSPTPTQTPSPEPSPIPTVNITTTPLPTTSPAPDLETLFIEHSTHYNTDRELLKKIAKCESSFNTNAANGPYGGMFQFAKDSWETERRAMGLDTSPELRFDANEAIRTAAYKISIGGQSAWPSCSK